MASNVTAQSVLEKISVDHLECSICTNRFRQPKVLDCLHTFCLRCLQELRQRQNKGTVTLTCPLCRQETMLDGKVIDDLPTNFALTALVEEVTMMEQLITEGQGSEIKCQACDESNQAVSICRDCDHFLCRECQRAHEHMAVMKSHSIHTLAQLRTGQVAYKSKLREEVPRCGQHPDQNLSFYCETCAQLVCTTCSVLDHRNKTHTLVGLTKAVETCKRQVAKLVAKAEQNKTALNKAIQETDKSRQKLDATFDDTKTKIDQKGAVHVSRINNEVQKLKQELKTVYDDRCRVFETAQVANSKEVAQTEHKLDEVGQLMAQASCYEILDLKKKLLHNVRELTVKQPHRVPERFASVGLVEGQGSLGRLHLGDEPKLETFRRHCQAFLTQIKNHSIQYLPFIVFVPLYILYVRLTDFY
ncbi:E3 ubiquitin-protein ligase TRIM71-like [Patiria miniata]|uniref:Uncharacterized protein n=1 Tax=Patiria miniata TaxID=46514 RepID=A0A914A579_PATMI|nr:E3 ubiquitin-protein ligase TRIM71-like [Patiria miniata]